MASANSFQKQQSQLPASTIPVGGEVTVVTGLPCAIANKESVYDVIVVWDKQTYHGNQFNFYGGGGGREAQKS